ncbi:B3 domain-containing protein At3g18960 [Linum perenne]
MAEEANRMTKNPQLFKLMTLNTLRESKLAIPKWFVEEYGAQLSNSILLKLPNGVKWKLKLFRRGGKIWFNEGWLDFANFYSISYGSFLILEYLGDSSFLVKIFSCNASEIRYPARDLAN